MWSVILGCVASAAVAVTQPAGQGASSPAQVDAQACAQAQMVVDGLLNQMATRLEAARLSNSAADMRAAIDGLQGSVRDLRAQLAPCAALITADPHEGHLGHGTAPASGTATPSPATGTKKPPQE
jgi:hypothetical protein